MRKAVLLIAIAAIVVASPAVAREKNGFYIGGSLGGSSLDVRDVDGADELYMLSVGATFTF